MKQPILCRATFFGTIIRCTRKAEYRGHCHLHMWPSLWQEYKKRQSIIEIMRLFFPDYARG